MKILSVAVQGIVCLEGPESYLIKHIAQLNTCYLNTLNCILNPYRKQQKNLFTLYNYLNSFQLFLVSDLNFGWFPKQQVRSSKS